MEAANSYDRLDAALAPFHHSHVWHTTGGGNMGAGSVRATAAGESHCDIIVGNGYVVTLDAERRVFERGAVAITDRRIVAVGTAEDIARLYRAKRALDARGGVIHPGFIDAHNHIVHTTCRGFLDLPGRSYRGVSFADWKADVTSEDEHVATQLSCLEMLRHGFTMFIEPGTAFDNDAVAEGAESIGVRGMLAGCYVWDQIDIMRHLGSLDSRSLYDRAPPALERCLDQLGSELHRNRDADALVRGYVSVYGLGTASDTLLRAAKKLADDSGVIFQQHEGYVPAASTADKERLGKPRITHLAEIGVLGNNSCLIHMNVLEDSDMPLIAQSGTRVIWCPAAYLQLGISAEAPCRLPELREQGVSVALGTDGALNCLIGDAGHAAYLVAASVGRPITPGAVIEMQTIEAARAAGLEHEIGSMEPGKRADIVVRGTGSAEAFPAVNPVHQLALTCRGGTVDTVIVDGKIVLRHGRSTLVDEQLVFAAAQASVKRRMARLGLEPSRYWASHGS
jgi:cytosine/adenosine deaminase-related metal-dependent hydrolase